MLEAHDHRSLAERLDLFHFEDDAPAMVYWHPNGWLMYQQLKHAVRENLAASGYREVCTPQVLRRPVWEASGHWHHFRQGMFQLASENEATAAALKPVSCPGHVQIVRRALPSYRELPLRLAEFGVVHRDEPSGTLHGLLRLRQFTQDDGHVFCTPAQAPHEVARFLRSVGPFYAAFGFERISVGLSTRPPERFGEDALWDAAEAVLANVLDELGMPYVLQPGEGAFYGPKIEFVLTDRAGRRWQCGTIQYDFSMPERFDLRYVTSDGARVAPVMLHRALFGSLERFLGILLEHHGPNLPAWLAPTQVRVLPVADAHAPYAQALVDRLRRAKLRVDVDADDSVPRRVLRAHDDAVPHVLVVGSREVASETVSIRHAGEQRVLPIVEAESVLVVACARPKFDVAAGTRGGGREPQRTPSACSTKV